MNVYVELLLSLLLIGTALMVTRVRSLFALMVLLSVFSGLMATLFSLLGAADVSFTEAVVGSGVSTLFLMALIRQVDPGRITRRRVFQRALAALVAAGIGAAMLYGVLALPEFGAAQTVASEHVADYYLRHAYADAHTPNVVTAVLADYRSFDTLIEAAVVLTAALACLLVLHEEDHDPAL